MPPDEVHQAGSLSLKLGQLRAFSSALQEALLDVRIAADRPVLFYYDTDVVLHSISGLTRLEELRDIDEHSLALHALLARGALGPINLLRPHLVEFDRKIRSWPRSRHVLQDELGKLVSNALVQLKLDKFLARIREFLKIHNTREQSAALANLLQEEGLRGFIKLELCFGGTWLQRLARARNLDLFEFEPRSREDALDPRGKYVREFLTFLDGRRSQTVNNLMDSLALASLARMVESEEGPVPRFYTETEDVLATFSSGLGRALLCDRKIGSQRSILRNNDYFVMRCSFAPLSWKANQHSDGKDEVTLEELNSLGADLEKILISNRLEDSACLQALKLKFGDRPLGDVVDDFYELRFIHRTVLEWLSSGGLLSVFAGFEDMLIPREVSNAASLELAQQIERLGDEISTQIGAFKNIERFVRLILSAMSQRDENNKGERERLAVEGGIGRWGLESKLTCADSVQEWLDALTGAGRLGRAFQASELAVELDATEIGGQKVEELTLKLWMLKLEELLDEKWVAWSEVPGIDPDLEILILVNRVRLQSSRDAKSNWDTVRDSIARASELANIAGPERCYRLMGLAHVTYWAWSTAEKHLSLAGRDSASSRLKYVPSSQEANEWCKVSFNSAWMARKLFTKESIAWMFATNHCAFIGLRSDIEPEKSNTCYGDLSKRTRGETMHYRFADTLAMPFSREARQIMADIGIGPLLSQPSARDALMKACAKLQEAKELLEKGKPFFGDREAEVHHRQVLLDITQLKCDR